MSASNIFSLGSMIKLMLFGGLVAVIALIVQSCQPVKSGLDRFAKGPLKRLEVVEAPPPQPTLEFKMADNQTMTLQDYRGKVVLLNVWATWCPPCVVEMPMLDELQAKRGGDDFQVVTVSNDRIQVEPQDFFIQNGITHLTPWHDATFSLPAKVGARGLPVSIFYDRKGREVARISGEVDWTQDEVDRFIDYLIQ